MPGAGWNVCDGQHVGVFAAAVLVSVALSATYLVQDYGRVHALMGGQGSTVGFQGGVFAARSAVEIPNDVGLVGVKSQRTDKDLAMGSRTEGGEISGISQAHFSPGTDTLSKTSKESGLSAENEDSAQRVSQRWIRHNLTSGEGTVFSDDAQMDSPYDGCSAVRKAPREEQCGLSKQKCKTLSGDSIIDYISVHYCTFNGNPLVSVPLFTAGLLLAFYLLADTAENFFCPTVTTLSAMLNLAPNTAGVTLLALGNGAPDLLGSLASFNNGDPHIIVGAILSAGTFVTSFVVGSVALFVAPFPVEGPAFMRDAAMYALGVVLVLVLYSGKVLRLWQAAGLVLYYILFVGTVIFFDRREHAVASPARKEEEDSHEHLHVHPHEHKDRRQHGQPATDQPSTHPSVVEIDVDGDRPEDWLATTRKQQESSEESGATRRLSASESSDGASSQQSSLLENLLSPCERCHSGRLMEHPGMPHSKSIVCQESSVGRGLTSASVAFDVVRRPIHCLFDPIRWATVPTGQHPEHQDVYYSVANVLFCPAIFLWGLDSTFNLSLEAPLPLLPQLPTWLPLYFIAVLVGSVSWARSHSSIPPLWVVVTSFSLSITWVGIFARELLGLLSSLGALLGASDALLGVTILAWGNSIGDLVTNVTMALSGQPMMAVAGCFAGPLFNLMLGLGIPLTAKTAWMYPEPWLFQDDPHISLVFPFLLTSVVGSLCAVYFSGYKVTRVWGFFLIVWYMLFIVVSVLMELILDG